MTRSRIRSGGVGVPGDSGSCSGAFNWDVLSWQLPGNDGIAAASEAGPVGFRAEPITAVEKKPAFSGSGYTAAQLEWST